MSTSVPTVGCATQWESQVNGYTNQGTNDIFHFISDGKVVSWIDFDGNAGGNLASSGGNILPSNNTWTGTNIFSAALSGIRVYANQGTAYSGNDTAFAISGWGAGGAIVLSAGYDPAFSFSITAAGTPSLNPTIVVTFKNGSWGTVPQYLVTRNDTSSPYWGVPHTISVTATTLTITFNGTPVAGTTYRYICMGIGN